MIGHLLAFDAGKLAVENEMGETVHGRPKAEKQRVNGGIGRLVLGLWAQGVDRPGKRILRRSAGREKPLVIGNEQIVAEHQMETAGKGEGEAHIAYALYLQPLGRRKWRSCRIDRDMAGQFLETEDRHFGQEAGGTAEMMGGGGRGHAGAARSLPKRKSLKATLGEDLVRRADQRFAQVSMVIARPLQFVISLAFFLRFSNLYIVQIFG